MSTPSEVITIRAPRRIDFCTAPFLAKDLDEKLKTGVSLILDLSQTQFIEPSSTEVLIQGALKSKLRHARLSLQGVTPQVKVVLELGGVLSYFRRK